MNFFVRLSVASWFLKVLSTLTFMLQLRDFYLFRYIIILVSQEEHTSTNDNGDVPYVESVVEDDGEK